jgi:hypothetical protein
VIWRAHRGELLGCIYYEYLILITFFAKKWRVHMQPLPIVQLCPWTSRTKLILERAAAGGGGGSTTKNGVIWMGRPRHGAQKDCVVVDQDGDGEAALVLLSRAGYQ